MNSIKSSGLSGMEAAFANGRNRSAAKTGTVVNQSKGRNGFSPKGVIFRAFPVCQEIGAGPLPLRQATVHGRGRNLLCLPSFRRRYGINPPWGTG